MYRGKLHEGDQLTLDNNPFSERSLAPVVTGLGRSVFSPSENMLLERIIIKRLLGNGIAEVESETPLAGLAEKYGTVPLPPYLHRDATEDDKKRYQTVWAKNMGSAAAPTASLNMTEELLEKLKKKGVIIKYLTLHVGLGTFLPIRTDRIEEHKMHSEWFHIPEDTISEIEIIRKSRTLDGSCRTFSLPKIFASQNILGSPSRSVTRPCTANASHDSVLAGPARRIVALGTTVARTLEYYAKTGKTSGEDDIFIYPGFEFKLVDALITNFHAPKSTVLMLAAAFAGWENLHNAYNHAVEEKYNFLSYGDSMLIC
ncbi:S-adenosylmethionine:tRNA ribosyltransferase-isomerase [Candidatus Saccharibacteria bacterium]|nr:S-adenosylmethionine:tRNA ribosyltransferase-isomerase [Candidatus Saccharibacteria bacterium]